jgi:hypothetical protein
MYRNASVQLLQSFQPEEFKAFGDYLGKAIPKTNQEFILFKYLKKHYPDFKEEDLEMGKVLKQIFKKENNSENRKWLSNLMHKLSKFITDFLIEQEVKNSPRERDFLLGQAYRRLGQQDLLVKLIDESKKSEKLGNKEADARQKNLDIWSDWHLLRLHLLIYFSSGTQKTALGEVNLRKGYSHFEYGYLAVKLKLILEMDTLQRINGTKPLATITKDELDQLFEKIKESDESDKSDGSDKSDISFPLIRLYLFAYKMRIDPNDATFYELKDLVFQLSQKLDHSEYSYLINTLINYASFAIKSRKTKFYAEAADLFEKGLNTKGLIQDGQINPELLLGCVNSFCEIGKIEEAKKHFNRWKSALPSNMKKETIRAIEARLFFYQKRYDQVNELFHSDKKVSNYLLDLGMRATLIQSLYEQGSKDRILNECENLRQMLSRKNEQLSPQSFEGYSNFNRMVLALVKASEKNNSNGLAEKLNEYSNLILNNWLAQKVEELGN